jgi:hypothetical protein
MKKLTLKLTEDELRVLTTLASDQLFRKEFIDPKLPGYKQNQGDLALGKSIVGRLRLAIQGQDPEGGPAQDVHRRRSSVTVSGGK